MRIVTVCREGDEFGLGKTVMGLYRCGAGTDLRLIAYHLWVEDGNRDPVPVKFTSFGKVAQTLIVVPMVTPEGQGFVECPRIEVPNETTLRLELLEEAPMQPVRVWGTVWVEVAD